MNTLWRSVGFEIRKIREPGELFNEISTSTVDDNLCERPSGTEALDDSDGGPYGLDKDGCSRFDGPFQSFFFYLDDLLFLLEQGSPKPPWKIIHVARLGVTPNLVGTPYDLTCSLQMLRNEFDVLEYRYDIADYFCTSGLYNCGLSREELGIPEGDVKAAFVQLTSLDLARKVRTRCDTLAEEHAPFFVYRVAVISSQRIREFAASKC